MAPTAEDVVLAWNARYSKQDIEGALSLMSSDFVRLGDTTEWTPVEREGWAGVQVPFFKAFPDWTWDIQSLLANQDHVAIEFLEAGTFTKPYNVFGDVIFDPTGESYTERSTIHFKVNPAGLISEIRAYYTNNIERVYHFSEQLAALGVTPDVVHSQTHVGS
jgi:SnoaL-like domain